MHRWLRLAVVVAVLAAVAGKGKKHRHDKPGRALFDRLTSTTLSEVSVGEGSEGLMPVPLDVAPYSVISANASCGDLGTEEYCRDTPGKRGVVCDVCESAGGSRARRHPPAHAVDGDPTTWWQSPTLAAGQFQHVELVAALPDKMELLHVIIKSGPSPRPLAWSVEVSSSDGSDDWRMVRAFGDRDHCRKLWDLRPERRRRKVRAVKRTSRDDKLACSTQFASPRPLENGEMHVALGEGVNARRVRISFRAAHPSPPRQQYYSVRSLTLAARCLCHGHAATCDVDAKGAKCNCQHGTCGGHCQRCCSGSPWSPGRACEGRGCSCGERGECQYDDNGVELCVNCTENRAGPLCDRCLLGFFNAVSDGPCLPCNCDPEGSDGSCTWDRKLHRVACNCYPGFGGHLCDTCEEPLAVFPGCQAPAPTTPACKCDPRGVVDPTRICEEECECKPNVVGERCNACAPGHYGLSAGLSAGCRPCYCSHITDSCSLPTDHQPIDVTLPLGDAWLVTDAQGNETVVPSFDDQGKPFIINYEVEGWEHFYWLSTAFSGEQFQAYGGEIRTTLSWGIMRGDTGGNPTFGPDVIIIGADGTKLACRNSSHETPGQLEISVEVLEGGWYALGEPTPAGSDALGSPGPEPVSRSQLMDVLRDVAAIMLRAHYHFDQDEVRLEIVEIRGPRSAVAERCVCPRGYSGAQCERCAWAHVRVPHAPHAPRAECVPCSCNGHAQCDTIDGPCGPCQHNTTGANCERCLPGHYGNPVQGACKPCACPLFTAANNFSPNCVLASAEGDEYVCTQCPDGYSGDHCENCDFGYWGAPREPGGACRACACGGSPCHPATGACLTCPANTEGARCDLCMEGYWFGPGGWSGAGCVACACGAGALSAACDVRTGQCTCRRGWAGRACDSCANGYGGLSAGCPVCRCGSGAISPICSPATGECACAAGAAPPSCDACLEQYYGIDETGCKGCNCSSVGAESNVCDIRSGQCRCRAHAAGRACDTCEQGYWGLERGGCKKCNCGAGTAACDPVTGACACAVGVGGAQCDRCLAGYYGFSSTGCLPCPACKDGKVCSPHSGRCVCPGGSLGADCRQCARGYWLHGSGCRACACGRGAQSDVCDARTGQCKCRSGWAGPQCESCAAGHYGPRCRPCHCHAPGTRDCNSTVCGCDHQGRCPCKENVVGARCDTCLEGTFGLSASNPAGCTACFCFGRAASCSQAELARAAVHATAPAHLTLRRAPESDTITNVDQDSLLAIHTHAADATITLPWPPVPVYMELDKRFLGDRVTSYGGSLRFRVEEEGGSELSRETLARFPLVRIYSKDIVLDYYEHVPVVNGTHAVRLHESLWTVRGRRAASRGALMLALLRVERILLRATTRAPAVHDPVHALLLNVSLDTAIPGLSRSAPALGVELCDCPRQYAASSCQEPAVGFWMPPPTVHMTSVSGTIVIRMEGEAKPCHCNNRATHCDPETGNCLNCTHGTGGPRCATCAAGHYGAPDAAGGCQPCPCPSRAANFADACALAPSGRLQCLCKPGYTGVECESCAAGHYRRGHGCVPCGCDPRGAASARCDARGRCTCRPHAAGDKCDACAAARTYLHDDGCRPCDKCTQTLLDSVEQLTSHLRARANSDELRRIPKPFPAVREFAQNASTLRSQLHQTRNDLAYFGNLEPSISRLEAVEHKMFTNANKLKDEATRRDKEAEYLSLESMSALEDVLKQRGKIGEQVAVLDDFARGERHLSAHRALKEARHLLKEIKEMKVSDYVTGANDVFDSAHVQSTAVQEYNYRIQDTYRRLRKLVSSLDSWERKAADLPQLAKTVWNADDAVTALQGRVKPRLAVVRDIGLRCRLVLEDITTLSSPNLTDEIGSAVLRAHTLSIRFPSLAAELEVLTLAAEEKEGILYNLTPVYREKYLETVQTHVKGLSEKASEYKSLFAGTRAAASLGVTAAQAWANVAAGVRDAQALADQATRNAASAAALARGPSPMSRVAAKGKVASESLRRRGEEVLAKAEELRTQLEQLRRGADIVSVVLRGVGWQERELGARPEARVAETLAAADAQADRVYAMTRALYDEASELRRRVRYSLRRQLAELQKHGDTALGAAQEHVSQIRGNTMRGAETAEALATAAAARARQHEAAAATLTPALRALRDKVLRAKHAADSISVSLTSVSGGAGCSRGYSVGSASGAASRVALAVSFENAVRDGPLLSLVDDTQDKERYMKLSVEDKRLRLAWDLGAGEAAILHPEILQPTHDDADHTSYRIDIERIWNTVHLKVERAGGSSVTASNSSGPDAASLSTSQLWLGARGGAGAGLPGCVHALYTDDTTVGLWNFNEQPKEAQCTGCTQRWYGVSRGGEPTMAWFSGRGYAELRRSRLRPADRRQFSIAFTFRTRDENALLFSAVDVANNRSVSVILRNCRVEFIVQYSGARLRIAAGGAHCDDRPKHVQAIRVFATNKLEKGSLRVNGEETLGSPSPPVQSAAALPDLSDATYWVGGAPPSGRALQPPLLGCLGALTVDREGYDLLDTPTRHGIEPRCGGRTFRSAILEGEGYIELPSPLFRRKAALGLSFRTARPRGLLLLRGPARGHNQVDDDGDDKHYLAIVLADGELEVTAAAGKGEVKLRTNGTKFDDKRLHTVRLVRAHKQLELWVDDNQVASGVLPGNAYPARWGGLFLGGVDGEGDKLIGVPHEGFKGTLADFIVDSQLIGLETAIKWSKAQLGRGEEAPLPAPRAEPRAPHELGDASPCTKTASYTVEAGAVKFGDARWSHATLRARRAPALALAMEVRTHARDGLLLLVPGSKNKPKHYTALLIREGRLRLVVRGRKRKEVSLTGDVATGTWRSVSLRVGRARAVLASGGEVAAAHAAPPQRAQRLYVGGIPAPPTLPNIPNSIIRVGGFRGCVRRVTVNGRAEDLVRDAQAHRGVGQCFPSVERGAYFGGDAHATWSSSWSRGEAGAALELSLQFRTTAASGVLLAAAGLLLEVQDGAVVLSSQQAAGAEWARVSAGGGGGGVCGGSWHSVRARVHAARLALALDGAPPQQAAPPAALIDEEAAAPRAPLHLGGLPEGVIDTIEGGKENFKGCIRDVTIGGETKDWADMETFHNVLMDSCPVQ